jgi:hypothetical protein
MFLSSDFIKYLSMIILNRRLVLDTLIKHETLTIDDVGKEENLGLVPNKKHLQFLLDVLTESGHLNILANVTPCTYSITQKGIEERKEE